jgi:hypothetical protein
MDIYSLNDGMYFQYGVDIIYHSNHSFTGMGQEPYDSSTSINNSYLAVLNQ